MLGKNKNIKTFNDLELDSKPMPMAAEGFLVWGCSIDTNSNSMLENLINYRNNYQKNWDGDGAMPMGDRAYSNSLEIIEKYHNRLSDNWYLELDTDGSVLFLAKNNKGTIRIRENNTFAYSLTNGVKVLMYPSTEFSLPKIRNVIKLWETAN